MKVRLKNQWLAEDFGDSLASQIVESRADAPGCDNNIGAAQSVAQSIFQPLQIVSYCGLEMQIQAHRGQLLSDMGRVGVHDLSKQ